MYGGVTNLRGTLWHADQIGLDLMSQVLRIATREATTQYNDLQQVRGRIPASGPAAVPAAPGGPLASDSVFPSLTGSTIRQRVAERGGEITVELTPGDGGGAFVRTYRIPSASLIREAPAMERDDRGRWMVTLRANGRVIRDHTLDGGAAIDETVSKVVLYFGRQEEAARFAQTIAAR
jgi:hypothetical protein